MGEKMVAKGIRITQQDIGTVKMCQEYYGLGTFSDAIRFIIRAWGREGVADIVVNNMIMKATNLEES